jgi:5-methylcytosine-specific restriction endonuclease McrA
MDQEMTMHICTHPKCGRKTATGNRCPLHPRTGYGRPHRRAAAATMANATVCWICRLPRWPGDLNPKTGKHDPMTADHLTSLARGGSHTPTNYGAAHGSCNSRRGATQISIGRFNLDLSQ